MNNPRKSTTTPASGDLAAARGPVSTPGRTDLNDPHVSGDAQPGRSDAVRSRSGPNEPTASDVSDGQRLPGSQDGAGTEPRAGTRLGGPSSQGLSGAQGSGGGAERGINEPPARKRSATGQRARSSSTAEDVDDDGTDASGAGGKSKGNTDGG